MYRKKGDDLKQDLQEILNRVLNRTPKYTPVVYAISDIVRAKTVLDRLLKAVPINEISSIEIVPKEIEEV